MDFTVNQWAVVGLVLILGWLLGVMSSSSGRRWKRELDDERAAHEAARRDYETRIAELERDRVVAEPVRPVI